MAKQPATRSVTIEVADEFYQKLAEIFKDDEAATKFAGLAFQEFYSWITGVTRYRTLTEQQIERVQQLYATLLPPNETPTVEKLYNDFNMTYGQAAYISRVLSEKNLLHWRRDAIAQVKKAVGDKKRSADEQVRKGLPANTIEVRLRKLATRELMRIAERMGLQDEMFLMPVPKSVASDTCAVAIPAQTIIALCNTPELK
jgi:hypothetical protein